MNFLRRRSTATALSAFVLGVALAAVWAHASPLGGGKGSLWVVSEPSGIAVRLDGQPVGKTPLNIAATRGEHELRLDRGGRALNLTVTVLASGETVHHVVWPDPIGGLEPLAASGELEIQTEPSGATVEVDGRSRGRSPVSLMDVAAGDHHVVVRNQGVEYRRTVRVERGALASVTISTAPTATTGWIAVESGIPLQIIERGAVIGSTDAARTLIAAGSHELEFAAPALGFRVHRTVDVSAGKTTSFAIPLEQAALSVNAVPWAEVFLDGVRIGETPLASVMTLIGPHVVELSHPQFGRKQVAVQVSLTQPARVSVDMRAR